LWEQFNCSHNVYTHNFYSSPIYAIKVRCGESNKELIIFMESKSNTASAVPWIVGGIVAILVCCACVVILAAGGIIAQAAPQVSVNMPTNLPILISPFFNSTDTPLPPIELTRPPVELIPPDTLQTLMNTIVPESDPYEIACRLQNVCNIPRTVPSGPYQAGDQKSFWVMNMDRVEIFQVAATLRYVTPHTYFWIENGVRYNEGDLRRLGDTFENKMYPTNREFFGSEWSPGVDEDPRIYILYTRGVGATVAGYFSSSDSFHPLVSENSNGHEMFVFNADNVDLASQEAYSVLAHEFQHMIHFNTDRNEDGWMNEGFSVLAELLNGYPVYFASYYTKNPDINLTDWSSDPGSNGPHYGQSFLYLAYLLDRFGEDVTKTVVKHPENGLESIDITLSELNLTDPQTGKAVTADDIFVDWAATMWLMDKSVGDGRYHYNIYPEAPRITVSENLSNCPTSSNGTVHQYGIDYYTINCAGDHILRFNGSTTARLLPEDAYSGDYAFWSNRGDESNTTLTREFDFTNVNRPIEISYWMWHDIEKNWDYLYLEASTDGQTWEILKTPSGTDYDPSGNSYGWGYTGSTGRWIQESVDLSRFAGQKVQIRFDYITDAAVNGQGFLLDDVRVDAVNYRSDFEADDGGWIAEGFARVQNVLPQTFRLSLILKGATTTVTEIPLNADQTVEIPLSLKRGEEAILVISGTTRFTRLPAAYQVEIR
jgi:immune inhibitor A